MKTISQPAALTPGTAFLTLLAAAVVFVGATGRKLPLLSDIRMDIIVLLLLGMTICALGGIGRVSATAQWAHPLSILGYVLGTLIVVVALGVFAGWKIPLVHTDQQALITIAILMAAKVAVSVLHDLLSLA